MKKKVVCGSLALMLAAGVALAAILFLTVTAPPYTEVAGSATVDGVSNLYITIIPSAEIPRPTTILTVYEEGERIWSGRAVAVTERLIKRYTVDKQRNYTLEIGETDGLTVIGQLLYD